MARSQRKWKKNPNPFSPSFFPLSSLLRLNKLVACALQLQTVMQRCLCVRLFAKKKTKLMSQREREREDWWVEMQTAHYRQLAGFINGTRKPRRHVSTSLEHFFHTQFDGGLKENLKEPIRHAISGLKWLNLLHVSKAGLVCISLPFTVQNTLS